MAFVSETKTEDEDSNPAEQPQLASELLPEDPLMLGYYNEARALAARIDDLYSRAARSGVAASGVWPFVSATTPSQRHIAAALQTAQSAMVEAAFGVFTKTNDLHSLRVVESTATMLMAHRAESNNARARAVGLDFMINTCSIALVSWPDDDAACAGYILDAFGAYFGETFRSLSTKDCRAFVRRRLDRLSAAPEGMTKKAKVAEHHRRREREACNLAADIVWTGAGVAREHGLIPERGAPFPDASSWRLSVEWSSREHLQRELQGRHRPKKSTL